MTTGAQRQDHKRKMISDKIKAEERRREILFRKFESSYGGHTINNVDVYRCEVFKK